MSLIFRTRCILLALSLGLGLTGCSSFAQGPDTQPVGTALEMAAAIIDSQAAIVPMEPLSLGADEFSTYLSHYYGLEPEQLSDGAICYAGGVEASEIAVLALADAGDAGLAEDALLAYIDARADDFTGYVPDQAAMAEAGAVAVNGRYVALLICSDPETAREAFLTCFEEGWTPPDTQAVFAPAAPVAETPDGSSPPPLGAPPEPEVLPEKEPSQKPELSPALETPQPDASIPAPEPTPVTPDAVVDSYDAAAVLAAWHGGDPSGLSEKNRAVYDSAAQVIGQRITQEMTDYDKELSIHDWMTQWGDYDVQASSHDPNASPDPDNDNPYGFLVNQVGICRGYASTFQLFMDLLDIECVTVPGASGSGEHVWNMVRLEGEWYCVDVTWDDPSGGLPGHRYFNVTSQFLRNTDHRWDESSVPEASATVYAWKAG